VTTLPRWPHHTATRIGTVALLLVLSACGHRPPAGPALTDLMSPVDGPALAVHFVDIGQGDGMVVKTPGGRTILVDTGPQPATPRLIRYLKDLDVQRIDLIVNTHAHADHIGGTADLIREYEVGGVLDTGFPHETPVYEDMLTTIEQDAVPFYLGRKGQTVDLGDGARLRLLAPEEPFVRGSRSDPNANSLVARLEYGRVAILLTGDAEHETEERLLDGPRDLLAAQVLKVAHHGSRYASEPGFLSAVNPRLAIISCSSTNRYGHPAPETVRRLRDAGAEVIVTADVGNVIIRTNGQRFSVFTSPRGAGPFGAVRWSPETAVPLGSGTTRGPPPGRPKVNINTADVEALARLPGLGVKTAERIVRDRETYGHFGSTRELLRVKGIGESKLERLLPYITVD
jgi:competence ComEA-like helix-hairpin-helix protein